MTSLAFDRIRSKTAWSLTLQPALARALLLTVLSGCIAASLVGVTSPETKRAVVGAGADLTNLLRFMAALKAVLAVVAAAAVVWRLGVGVTVPRLLGYAVACGAMASGPGLIWAMAHVGMGALLLHGGLAATGVMLWRDPAVASRLDAVIHTGKVRGIAARQGRRV